LSDVSRAIVGSGLYLGAQNLYAEKSGAFTGEIAPDMLLTIGVTYVILGHSERREYFTEIDQIVNSKARMALDAGLIPIICVGEKIDERQNGQTEEVVSGQIEGALAGMSESDLRTVVIAYEPVWAIGTGKTATPEMAQETHSFIRGQIREKFGNVADEISILYGGSMKGSNAADLLKQPDIDGGLIGGASLKADEFIKIINSV
jgi:triosephosphate isomerase